MLLVLLKISNVAIIFVICAVYFVSYAECVPYPTESPEYYSYLNKIAKARKVHETKVYLEQKNQILDYNPPDVKYAIEETPDHWINKFNNRYANAAEQYSKTKRPRPIVDTASKNELEQVSRTLPTDALVANLFEGFSNFINQIIEKQMAFTSKVWRKGLRGFDKFGGKLLNLNN